MADTIILRCSKAGCPRKRRVPRDPTDHPKAAVVKVLCDWHDDGGGFPETTYYDAAGKQLLDDPMNDQQRSEK